MNSNDNIIETPIWQKFDQLYNERSYFLSSSATLLGAKGPRSKQVEEVVSSFASAAKATVECLECLSQIHPFIAVAVQPFKFIIKMDIVRRDNDMKVISIHLCIKNLMNMFLELRRFRNPGHRTYNSMTIAERLESTMIEIANEIKECGSACESYSKKSVLTRIIKSKIYEEHFGDFIGKFELYRQNLMAVFSAHTAQGVDMINSKVNELDNNLQDATEFVKEGLAFLRRISAQSTARETEIMAFINEHDGIENCLDNDSLFKELAFRAGDLAMQSAIASSASGQLNSNEQAITKKKLLKQTLLKEISEEVVSAFKENMVLFERKLELQQETILRTLRSGAHDLIADRDLQTIWREMSWKGSVKARHFVLALHDYYNDPTRSSLYRNNGSTDNIPSASTIPSMSDSQSPSLALPMPTPMLDDEWALSYINPTFVQPILEAIDDDGTGFISVKEVNTFVASRPNGWSLPRWLAFWASGWQSSVMNYRAKICSVVRKMYQTLEYVKIANRQSIDQYLFSIAFTRVEILIRSLRPMNDLAEYDFRLFQITKEYTTAEEQRMEANLNRIKYELDTPATISLVTGEGRIERYLLPLIYLLLRHHLKFILIACIHIIDREEMSILSASLSHVFDVVNYRVQNLEALFRQTNPAEVQSRFDNFAFGMFRLLNQADISTLPIENAFSEDVYQDDDGNKGEPENENETESLTVKAATLKKAASLDPPTLLKFGVADGVQTDINFAHDHQLFDDETAHPLEGTWTTENLSIEAADATVFAFRLSLHVDSNQSKLTGMIEGFYATYVVDGTVQVIDTGYEVTLTSNLYTGTGIFNKDEGVLTLTWSWSDQWSRYYSEPRYEPTQYRRIPAFSVQYRYTPIQLSEDAVRSHWDFLRNSILYFAQQRHWRGPFLQARLRERLRFLKLTLRDMFAKANYSPQQPLDETEVKELKRLRLMLTPNETRFYRELAIYQYQTEPDHLGWYCNSCDKTIRKSRILCLYCIGYDFSETFDLCICCIAKVPNPSPTSEFTHMIWHDMVKVNFFLHPPFLVETVQRARGTADRFRRSLTANTYMTRNTRFPVGTQGTEVDEISPSSTKFCACCDQVIALPCWVCLDCAPEVIVCSKCETEEKALKLEDHTTHHHLVRIAQEGGSTTQEVAKTVEAQTLSLQQGVINMEQKMSSALSAIDAKVEQRLSNLEERVGLQLSNMESLLHQIVAQISPPLNYNTDTTTTERSAK